MTSYKFKINGKPDEVSVNGIADGVADVTVNGASYSVEIENAPVAAAAPAPQPMQPQYSAPPTYGSSSSSNRFADEDYIPDFLKR